MVPFPMGGGLLPASWQPAGMWWGILGKIVQGIVEMLCFDDDDYLLFFSLLRHFWNSLFL